MKATWNGEIITESNETIIGLVWAWV